MNLFEATVDGDAVVFGQFRVPLARENRPPSGGRVVLGVRPEAFAEAAIARSGKPTIDVDVRVVEELGSDAHVLFSVDAPTVAPQSISSSEAALLLADAQSLFTARLEAGTAAAAGARLTLSVDPGRFHFFDPATGERFSAEGAGVGAAGVRGRMTKQREARERVLDLIERLASATRSPLSASSASTSGCRA